MTTVYKILNPLNGEYVTANSADECFSFMADIALNLLTNYTHGAPYSVVDINEDGTQIWRNPQGDEIADPIKVKEKIAQKMGGALVSIPATPVETYP